MKTSFHIPSYSVPTNILIIRHYTIYDTGNVVKQTISKQDKALSELTHVDSVREQSNTEKDVWSKSHEKH
jgi:ArsR family metal-binding transcriptional regulator